MKLPVFSGDWTNLAVCGALVLAFIALGLYAWLRKRPTPAELETRRLSLIDQIGKMGDGTVSEMEDLLVSYSYHVRGVEYLATQDVSALEARMPANHWRIVGPVSVKFDPRNPANSIIVSEQWTGLRRASAKLEQ